MASSDYPSHTQVVNLADYRFRKKMKELQAEFSHQCTTLRGDELKDAIKEYKRKRRDCSQANPGRC